MKHPLKLFIQSLDLTYKRSTISIPFKEVSYFYGQMGAGKSSIARLIDYCLGGGFDLTPALQSEFVSATLHLLINDKPVSFERPRDSNKIHASWEDASGKSDIIIPARKPEGIVIPDSNVEVLSDLIFWLSDIIPPKVTRSKSRETTELNRLSFRDILWYCYLDQDSFDNNFFNLDADANIFKKYKSQDVLRYLLGFHQDQVVSLESQLQELHFEKTQIELAAKTLAEALAESDASSEEDLKALIDGKEKAIAQLSERIDLIRSEKLPIPHGADILREQARSMTDEISSLEDAIFQVANNIDKDQRHVNEITTLGIKIKRVAVARAVLGGVNFESCPRCAQNLPHRLEGECTVCGQQEPTEGALNLDYNILEQDAKDRIDELEETIKRHKDQLRRMRRRIEELTERKKLIDLQLSQLMKEYDSAYLSSSLVLERERAELGQQIMNLNRLIQLPRKVDLMRKQASEINVEEIKIRKKLEEARKGAQADTGNIKKLSGLFLDCLVRAGVPGITFQNEVEISYKDFLPKITDPEFGDITVTSFANLSSGGKKTLFKSCFALAVHRLSAEIGASLPTLLIIDSPMKNISERENVQQFEGFHKLLYELLQEELLGTQLIIIDKEHYQPEDNFKLGYSSRHMKPDSDEFPPLIPYYRSL